MSIVSNCQFISNRIKFCLRSALIPVNKFYFSYCKGSLIFCCFFLTVYILLFVHNLVLHQLIFAVPFCPLQWFFYLIRCFQYLVRNNPPKTLMQELIQQLILILSFPFLPRLNSILVKNLSPLA